MNFNAIPIEIKWISTALYLDSLEEIYSSIQILKVNRNKIEHEISYIYHYNRAAKKSFVYADVMIFSGSIDNI